MTTDLADFLLARIADDEAVARRAVGGVIQHGTMTAEVLALIRGWDSSRVLAECEAKRRIVKWCTHPTANPYENLPVLGMLAQPYADHADYREEWKP